MEFINANDLPAAGAMGTDNKVIVQQGDKFVLMTLAELLSYMASASVETDPTLTLEGVAAEALATGKAVKTARAVNLLDNSHFFNPVKQRGITSIAGPSASNIPYFIDRWLTYGGGTTFDVSGKKLKITNNGSATCGFVQRIAADDLKVGKVYTLAFKAILTGEEWFLSRGTNATNIADSSEALEPGVEKIHTFTFTLPESLTDVFNFRIRSTAVAGTAEIEWAALYEGEYTAETLPEYQPKGYAAELAECLRYFINKVGPGATGFYLANSNQFRVLIPTPVPMRVKPTVSMISTDSVVSNVSGATTAATVSAAAVSDMYNNGVSVTLTTNSKPGSYAPGTLYSGFNLELSADL